MQKLALLGAVVALALAAGCSSSTSSPSTAATDDAGAVSASDGAAGDDAGATDTWASWAEGFFRTYCVECHGAGNTTRDYSTMTDVVRDHAEIRCGVAPTKLSGCAASPAPAQFPISNTSGTNPKPTDAERLRLVAWIEAGLKP